MKINFILTKVPHPTLGYAVRMFLEYEHSENERVRDMNAATDIVKSLLDNKAEKLPDGERLITDEPMPEGAVPLFKFWLTVHWTKHGFVYSRDYIRYDGCPVPISTEGMHLCSYVWAFAKAQNKQTEQNRKFNINVKFPTIC